jgi:agmatine/peptidylarginine deiminase
MDLMEKLQADNLVYIPVDNDGEKDFWIEKLTAHGIPLANFKFLYISTLSIHPRDYGPWFIWDTNNEMGIVNYTCHYPVDDEFPEKFADLFQIEYYESGLDHVGGNFYPNGYGTAFSTLRVYSDNHDLTKDQTNRRMYDYLGIKHYHTCVVAPWTIEHHDCWGKPADPETIIIAQFPEDSKYHPYGEGMTEYYETLESPWGRPYKIFRLPMFELNAGPWFEFKPYMNSLISNKKVFVPISHDADDPIALAVFEEAFPGYEIVGVDRQGCGWTDALHCRTRNFVRRDPIRIYPYPPGDTEDTVSGYPVPAQVIPPNGSSLQAGYPLLCWTADGGGSFNEITMGSTGNPDEYLSHIPPCPLGTEIAFYIEARDDQGRSALYPLVAPDGMMRFEVHHDVEAPSLSRFVPVRSHTGEAWPPNLRVLCKDDMATPEVKIKWEINGKAQADVVLAREELCYWYQGDLGNSAEEGDLVTYTVHATDKPSSPNSAVLPINGEVYCTVTGAGDVGIVNLSRRPATAPFLARILGSLGVPCTCYNNWPSDLNRHDIWFFCCGVFPENHVLSSWEADRIVGALERGKYIYLESGDAWCRDPEKETLNPYFGVLEDGDGDYMAKKLEGQPGTIVEGINPVYAGVNDFIDRIEAIHPAQVIFRSHTGLKRGRTVLNDTGDYRTIASVFCLGGLKEKKYPNTAKEILLRYLKFFGREEIRLHARNRAHLGETVEICLEGIPGEAYILFGSLADFYKELRDWGILRLDPEYVFILDQGVIPPEGQVVFGLPIPKGPELLGLELFVQAAVGTSITPEDADFSNRDILVIEE